MSTFLYGATMHGGSLILIKRRQRDSQHASPLVHEHKPWLLLLNSFTKVISSPISVFSDNRDQHPTRGTFSHQQLRDFAQTALIVLALPVMRYLLAWRLQENMCISVNDYKPNSLKSRIPCRHCSSPQLHKTLGQSFKARSGNVIL